MNEPHPFSTGPNLRLPPIRRYEPFSANWICST
jgi:hypothetical protein